MHKHVGLLVTVAAIVTISIVPSAADRLFALFFIGLVPFTNYTIAPSAMLILYALLLALGIYAIARILVTASSPIKRDIESRERARKKIIHNTEAISKKTASHQKKHFQPAVEHHSN